MCGWVWGQGGVDRGDGYGRDRATPTEGGGAVPGQTFNQQKNNNSKFKIVRGLNTGSNMPLAKDQNNSYIYIYIQIHICISLKWLCSRSAGS